MTESITIREHIDRPVIIAERDVLTIRITKPPGRTLSLTVFEAYELAHALGVLVKRVKNAKKRQLR